MMKIMLLRMGLLPGAAAGLLLWSLSISGSDPASVSRHDRFLHSAYLWQRNWNQGVREALVTAAADFDQVIVLAAEIERFESRFHARLIEVDWPTLADTRREIWPVIRAHRLPGWGSGESPERVSRKLGRLIREICTSARARGATIPGIQLDFDCPAEDLPAYGSLLEQIRMEVPGTLLSVTALPSWLEQPEFQQVADELDHFILQVHSLERPRKLEDPVRLCETARVIPWVNKASSFGRPFYVSLPTYGYTLHYGRDGNFLGIGAEGATPRISGGRVREVLADPVELSHVVVDLQAGDFPHLRGLAWFRLPVEGDRLNWSWPLLLKVMNGEVPKRDVRAEVRSPGDDLFEVWVLNKGFHQPDSAIDLEIGWKGGTVQAFDPLGSFEARGDPSRSRVRLTGPAPEPGEEVMALWLRSAPSDRLQLEVKEVKAAP